MPSETLRLQWQLFPLRFLCPLYAYFLLGNCMLRMHRIRDQRNYYSTIGICIQSLRTERNEKEFPNRIFARIRVCVCVCMCVEIMCVCELNSTRSTTNIWLDVKRWRSITIRRYDLQVLDDNFTKAMETKWVECASETPFPPAQTHQHWHHILFVELIFALLLLRCLNTRIPPTHVFQQNTTEYLHDIQWIAASIARIK